MCRVLDLCETTYYNWIQKPFSPRQEEDMILLKRIRELHEDHRSMAGSPMITADLRSETRFAHVGQNRVARIMRENGITCKTLKSFKVTTDSSHAEPVADNILNREFCVNTPNEVWVTDITYLKVGSTWCYLTVFIDLYSRAIVGWDLSRTLHRYSAIKALRKAIARRKPQKGLVIHSDRGIQYASKDFRAVLEEKGFIQSMSRKGNCWDNAVAESFFHTLKTQYTHHHTFAQFDRLNFGLFKYIEAYYNRRRRHSANGWVAPAIQEEQFYKARILA